MYNPDSNKNHMGKSGGSNLIIENIANSLSHGGKKIFSSLYKKYKYRFLGCIGFSILILALLVIFIIRIVSVIFGSSEVGSQINTLVQENAEISNLPQRRVIASQYIQNIANTVSGRLGVE